MKWDKRFFKLAEEISLWSKDPSTKIGAIIVNEKHQILAQGYNGFPRGIKDTPDIYANRELKYKYTVHAEANAIFNAIHSGSNIIGASIYIFGLPICHECAKIIIQCGIKEVNITSPAIPRWNESSDLAKKMLTEAKINLRELTI